MIFFLIRIGYYIVMVIIMFFIFVFLVFLVRVYFYYVFFGFIELKRELYVCLFNLLNIY